MVSDPHPPWGGMGAGLRVVWASALRTATERLGVNRAGAPVLAAAAQGQHELEEDQSEMSDIDVRSRQERESGGFLREVRARVRSAFGDG